MQIKDEILSPYHLDFDGIQYTLFETRVSAEGNSYLENHGYFIDLAYAVRKICMLDISKKDSLTLQEFIKEWKNLQNKFKPLFYEN